MSQVYEINKGVNKPVQFKGLQAQYIWWLGGGILALLFLFACMYIVGVNLFVCIVAVGGLGALLFFVVYRMSRKYGEFGLMKKMAGRGVPKGIRVTRIRLKRI
ncbi:MAG: DUF4133 domain-containing protein [Chitinophagales bacterium]